MPAGSFILPTAGRPVRVHAGESSVLADVLYVDAERIELVPQEPVRSGRAELMYSTPRGVVMLAGELKVGGVAVFVPEEQQRAEQRREAFRVPVHVEGELRRADGAAIAVATLDLSATGALLRGAKGLEREERVRVVLPLGDAPVELPAVVHRQDADDQFAVRFADLPRVAARALERFLAAEQRKLL
jgi:PilZ domain